jgi:integrase/recombinase XerD
MPTHSPTNERIKRQYLTFLKEAKRQSEATVDDVANALAAFEEDTKFRDFRAFRHEQAVAFKRHLAERQSQKTGGKLSKATEARGLHDRPGPPAQGAPAIPRMVA